MRTQRRWLLALLVIAATPTLIATTTRQRGGHVDWQQKQSAGVLLSVAPPSVETGTAIVTTFTVQGPGIDGLQSRTNRNMEPGKFTRMFFPDDFHRKPLPGRYLWSCRVGEKVVAQGEFVLGGDTSDE